MADLDLFKEYSQLADRFIEGERAETARLLALNMAHYHWQ
jgi:hypothetical protein